ncbi:MAG: hypothetical protein HRU17_11940 [Polyangiaceae bacterium]|nr:hypothetical protein [Polyangiaceae bacterium]
METPVDAPPPGSIWREDVLSAIDEGFGYFLQRVEVEPAFADGEFSGFEISQLRPHYFWESVDLQAGDVIHSVNGMPIERDTEAFAAFVALKDAPELRVSFSRAGQKRELVYAIVARKASPAPSTPNAPVSLPVAPSAPNKTTAPAQDAG